jgi:excinuclease ABC subunit A
VESLSAYARQFLEQLEKPEVEAIEGLSPAIAIEQRTAGGNPRSTVATQTEIYDYLRLLFARIGRVFCCQCGTPIERQSAQEIVERILSLPKDKEIQILAPLVMGRKGQYQDISNQVQKAGFTRIRIDGEVVELPAKINLDRYKVHNIEIVVDRLMIKPEVKARLTDSVETALKAGKGVVIVSRFASLPVSRLAGLPVSRLASSTGQPANRPTGQQANRPTDIVFSEQYACPKCGISYLEVEPRFFSFNSPYGACPACNGLGTKLEFDADLIVPDKARSINQGAIEAWKRGGKGYILYYRWLLRELAGELGFDLDTPFNQLDRAIQKAILYGCEARVNDKPFEGVVPHLERLFRQTKSDYLKEEISRFMSNLSCPLCQGARLKKESLSVRINGKNI